MDEKRFPNEEQYLQ